MKLIVVKKVTPREVEPGQTIQTDDGRVVVDVVEFAMDGVRIGGRPLSRTTGKRVFHSVTSDALVTVVATDEVVELCTGQLLEAVVNANGTEVEGGTVRFGNGWEATFDLASPRTARKGAPEAPGEEE